MKLFFPLGLVVGLLVGCETGNNTPKQTSLQIQAYQSQEFETDKRVAFNALVSVLQDYGYIIQSADFDTGFVTGKAPTKSKLSLLYGSMNQGASVSATVMVFGNNRTRVRLNFVTTTKRKSAWDGISDVERDDPVTDPKVYQHVFDKIGETIFVADANK